MPALAIADILDAGTETVDMRAALAQARAAPHTWRLPDATRRLYQEDFATLRKCGCDGPLVASIARALRLDQESRRAQG